MTEVTLSLSERSINPRVIVTNQRKEAFREKQDSKWHDDLLKTYYSQVIYKKFKSPICYLHSWYDRKYLDSPEFSEELDKGIFSIATVTYAMIQIAHYTGFDKIYLLGMDNRYGRTLNQGGSISINKGLKSYFGDQTQNVPPVASLEMEIAYEYIEKYSHEHGFRIYKATRGGHLEVFERVNLDEVLDD